MLRSVFACSVFTLLITLALSGPIYGQASFQQSWTWSYPPDPTPGQPAVAIGDLNRDGNLDMVVAVPYGDEVDVFLGDGAGAFIGPSALGLPVNGPLAVALADINGDGKLDILVALSNCAVNCLPGVVGVLLGNGDGTFQPAVTYSDRTGGEVVRSIAVADVNKDGKPDIVIVDGSSSTVKVLLGNGDGSFQPAVTYNSGGGLAYSIAVADVNRDGKPDLLVANYCGNYCSTVSVLLGNGDGTFQPAVTYNSGGTIAYSIAVADVNRDGKPDLLVANGCPVSGCGIGNGVVGVLLGNGDGTFQPAMTYDSGEILPSSLALADVNGDGKLDLLVANSPYGGLFLDVVSLLIGNGNGTFQTPTVVASGLLGTNSVEDRFLAVADFDGDGRPDFVVASPAVFLNTTSRFSPQKTNILLRSSSNPSFPEQAVTFTATVSVTGANKNYVMPKGTVSFYDGAELLSTASILDNGVTTETTSTLAVGTHSITATYNGAAYLLPSTSAVLSQVVKKTPTVVKLTSSFNPSYVNQSVSIIATVTGKCCATPTGTVTFQLGTQQFDVALVAGQATLNYVFNSVGTYTFTATYSGDANCLSSVASQLIQTVLKTPVFTVLHAFKNDPDGAYPHAGVIRDAAGNLYGTTWNGGSGFGTVFKVTASGQETVLYSFHDLDSEPYTGLVRDASSNLYGTTNDGGNGTCGVPCGSVFKLDSSGNFTVLHNFGGTDGARPSSSLILDSAGNLYGTTYYGGNLNCSPPYGCGTVFRIDTGGNETVLYSFSGGTDGVGPTGLVRDAVGNLYGATYLGGNLGCGGEGCGTLFKLDPNNIETVLHVFTGLAGDGGGPDAGVIRDAKGNLYGTTAHGGTSNSGTVFKLDTKNNVILLYSFTGGLDGGNPQSGLAVDAFGNLYGTTAGGGYGSGVIFEVSATGEEDVLYTLDVNLDGSDPVGNVLRDSAGNLYVTAQVGGTYGYGAVLRISE
jgi:uncharacterized repeat protein (TIGR03803 family)